MKVLPKTAEIEGCYNDYQFCAEKIGAYALQIGFEFETVRVTYRGGDQARIAMFFYNDDEQLVSVETWAKFDDIGEIMSAGYARASAIVSGFHVKN